MDSRRAHRPSELAPRAGHFPPGFEARVARLVHEAAARRRTPREDQAGAALRLQGAGGEFAGRRRYRPGDDLRAFDWDLYARGQGEHLRITSPESGERWCVVVDSSASMGVGARTGAHGGRPKLELAVQLAYGLCALGLSWGHQVSLAVGERWVSLSSSADLPLARAALAELPWAGRAELAPWFGRPALARVRRWILVGDLLDLEPRLIAGMAAARRRIDAVAVLAGIEWAPLEHCGGAVKWLDPESLEELEVHVDPGRARDYATALGQHLEHWRSALARTRGVLLLARADDDFEPHLARYARTCP
ncbi:MAG: DUF58 domain-containing protein [Planctomycetes bacterium]|jgi:uncharacterized protein (DUF58 family)|nr:DUF58 domain-containing protein [Planctomycetota bacterium]